MGWRAPHSAPACPPQCCLACHKKCLDTLAIQCGHKKLQGRLQLFGQDFAQAARSTPDGVPFIIKKCVCEIEQRALHTKVTATGVRGGSVPGGGWRRGAAGHRPGLTADPTGHLPRQRGEDARGEVVPGVRERQGAGGAVTGLAPRHQQRPQTLPAAGGAGRGAGAEHAPGEDGEGPPGRGCSRGPHRPVTRSCLNLSSPSASTTSLWDWPRTV